MTPILPSSDLLLILERLTRVEEKFDHVIERGLDFTANLTDHEKRIRLLEAGTSKLYAFGAVIAVGIGILGDQITKVLF